MNRPRRAAPEGASAQGRRRDLKLCLTIKMILR
nr:MAG TPA: hypothetical protein [Caudoviricetes sp.]